MNTGRSQIGNLLSCKLLSPLSHPGTAGIKDLNAMSERRLFLEQMGDQRQGLGTGSNHSNINLIVHKSFFADSMSYDNDNHFIQLFETFAENRLMLA